MAVAALLVPALASGNARPQPRTDTPLLTRLSGAVEVPGPGDPDGTGAAAVTVDADANHLCYDLSVSDITPAVAAHIHVGPVGVAGPIVVDLTAPSAGTSSGCVVDADAAAILAEPANFYVNVHTPDFPGGAIRGQLGEAVSGAKTFLLPEPLRAYDSRNDPADKLAPGQTRTISLQQGVGAAGTSVLAVPPGALAAIVTLTVTDTEGGGFVKLYSAALTTEPPTSNINWSESNQNLAVSTPVAVDAQGRVKITGGFGATEVVLDVTGYLY